MTQTNIKPEITLESVKANETERVANDKARTLNNITKLTQRLNDAQTANDINEVNRLQGLIDIQNNYKTQLDNEDIDATSLLLFDKFNKK